jgi:hypothetical protein
MTEYQMRCVNARKPHSHIVSAEVQEFLPADRAYGERKPLLVAPPLLPESASFAIRAVGAGADTCGCRKPHPEHRPGTLYQKERR